MHRSAFLVLLVATACGPDDAARQSSPASFSHFGGRAKQYCGIKVSFHWGQCG